MEHNNNNSSLSSSTTTSNSNSVLDKEKNFKEEIKKYFFQLNSGCFRDICYNPHCKKSKSNFTLILELTFSNQSEMLAEAMKLARSSLNNFCLDSKELKSISQYDPNISNISIKENVENLALNFMNIDMKNIDSINGLFGGLKYDFVKLKCFYKDYKEKYKAIEELNIINSFFSHHIKEIKNVKNYSVSLQYYLMYLNCRLLIYVSLHPFFGYLESAPEEIKEFFNNFVIFKRLIKQMELNEKSKKFDILQFFSDINKDIMSDLIKNYQDFLSVYFLSDTRTDLDILIYFIKTFKIIYLVNERYKIVQYKEFYNDTINKNLDIKRDFEIYFNKLKKKINLKDESFCLLSYPWLFDSASKSEVLYYYNTNKQRSEVFNQLMNLQNLSNFNLNFEIRRNNMIEDTLNLISNPDMNFKKPMKVKFAGEDGIDQGGVKKEFFMLLLRQLFDLNYGMFNYYPKTRLFWFNPFSFEMNMKYELIGIILGLGMFNGVILDVKLPLVVYKKLLGIKATLDDLKEIDIEHYNNLRFILNSNDENLEESLNVNFTVIVDKFGYKETINLKENGENIYVGQLNKQEYVDLYIDWFFNESVKDIFNLFCKGFYRVCDVSILSIIRPEELEQVICGNPELDFKELEESARYEDGYTEESEAIQYFWETIHEMNEEDKKKFLFFLTGCDRAPINGLKDLEITISRYGPDSDKLPCAHTCFNHLLLPDYISKEKLKERLLVAIQNSEGFGLM